MEVSNYDDSSKEITLVSKTIQVNKTLYGGNQLW